MPRNCGCGGSKAGGTGTKYIVVKPDGTKSQPYSSETDARMAASSQPGSRVRPA